ncbi:MAG: hypothetical protein A2Y77_09875 [Planctomycetes bacterium RBG_13_62_9]|nr:MAG: hypothetical protein A2Y77_09875 [Planctomycetes bacterium RBG_13_62_9]
MKKREEDILAKALAQLKSDSLSQELPKEVLDKTMRQMADSSPCRLPIRDPRAGIHGLIRLTAAAAVFMIVGYAVARLSAPKPMDLDQLREALAPSVAASIEPAIRARLAEDLQRRYQLALGSMYVRVKEELTEQYRDDLNRFAVQTLAASNAATNELLVQVVRAFDSAKAQDLRQIVQAIYEVEMNRVQDKKQLASGLQTLASRTNRTEDELSRTKYQFVRFLADVRPEDLQQPILEPKQSYPERSEP